MDTTIEQQAAMDEALVTHAQRLRIGRSNFRCYRTSNLRNQLCNLYMISCAYVHSSRLSWSQRMDMLHICPRVHDQSFDEPPFEEEILAFIHFLGHSASIRMLTDVNINNLYQPWRSLAAIINKCLTGKSSGYDSLRLFQAQILDDHMFSTIKLVSRHQNTQQFGALLPIELTNEEIMNSNAYKEYYAIATGAAPPKLKASVRRTRSSSDTSITPPTAAVSPRLTASVKRKQTAKASKAKSLSALSEEELSWNSTDDEGADNEGKDGDDDEEDEVDNCKEGDGDDVDEDDDVEEGDDDDQEVVRDDDKDDEMDDEEEGADDEQKYDDEETRDEKSFDPIPQTLENSNDESNGDEDLGLNVGGEEGHVKEEEEYELYRDVNINKGRGLQTTQEVKDSHVNLTSVNPDGQQQSSSVSSQFVTSMLNLTLDVGIESIFETASQMDAHTLTSVAYLPMTAPTMTPSTIATITTTSHAPILLTTRMNEAIKVAVQIQSDSLRDEAQRENDEFLKTVDENMQRIINEQVKEQVKVQVSKILSRIEQTMNEQLEAEVLTRLSHSSKTSYAVAADLSEMELNKILIEKMEGNKSIQRSDEQRNLYKAFVEAYASDKIILDTYRETVTLKRRRDDDADKEEEPSAGPDQGSKRRIEGKDPESASAPLETATRSTGRSTQRSQSRQASASESAFVEEPMQTTCQMEDLSHPEFDTGAEDQPIVQSSQHPEWFSQQHKPPSLDRDWNKTMSATHESIQPWISEPAKRSDSRSSFNELMDTPLDFSNFLINRLKVDTLTLKLLAGPTYELIKGSCKSLVELEYHLKEVFKTTTDQLDWVNPEGQ
nr:hypothetical protein [Tanacetum cinerariifolium]